MTTARNVLGEPLITCSTDPMTGFFRDGCCNTGEQDQGLHLVCAVMTDEFLAFSKNAGNDLSTPMPLYNFPGLKAGDRWCLCMRRWVGLMPALGNRPGRHPYRRAVADLETLRPTQSMRRRQLRPGQKLLIYLSFT